MKTMIIDGVNVAQGRVVKALEAMLDGDDSQMRRWDSQFYYIPSEIMDWTYMVRKEFNCLTVWVTHVGPTSFNDGDEIVQRQYHPLCLLDKKRDDDDRQDVCRDLVNGLIRLQYLRSDEYISFKED